MGYMNNLLLIVLVGLISVIIYYYIRTNKEGFRELDVNNHSLERCKTLREAKLKLNSPSCGIDQRCDHIETTQNEEIKYNEDGTIKIVKRDKISCIEGLSNKSETNYELQHKQCKDASTCEELGENCGYCDDNYSADGLGRFMWTNRGKEGSGMASIASEGISSADGKKCAKNKFYGKWDVAKCNKKLLQRKCKLLKSCNDFEKYADKKLDGICGFCPPSGKGVPIRKIGERNVPIYPEDTCDGGPELAKVGTLGHKGCVKFMDENPCVTSSYWHGKPDHSGECYVDLYNKAGGQDPKKKKPEWWRNQRQRGKFGVARDDMKIQPYGWLPITKVILDFKKLAEQKTASCFKIANKAHEWLIGSPLPPCFTQYDNKHVANRACQRSDEKSLTEMTNEGEISDHKNNYSIDECKENFVGSKGIGGFQDQMAWLLKNMPQLVDANKADTWYWKKREEAAEKFNEGDDVYKKFLKEIEGVMYAGGTYALRVRATRLLKGRGYDPRPPPSMKQGDYVELKIREHTYKGVLFKKKGNRCLIMWDYYEN